jgi:hypothetical protein
MVYCSTILLQCVDHVAIGIWEKIELQDALSGRLKGDRHGTVSCMDQIGRGRKISPPAISLRKDSCHHRRDSWPNQLDSAWRSSSWITPASKVFRPPYKRSPRRNWISTPVITAARPCTAWLWLSTATPWLATAVQSSPVRSLRRWTRVHARQ